MSSPSQKGSVPRDQYQHYIPRFILRRFQDDQIQIQKTKKQRRKDFNKARKTGVDPESVQFYDMASGTLERRSVGKVYGVLNLYRDVGAVANINHLEEKFSRLENDAAQIISTIHQALDAGHFTIRRRQLEVLRKFIFLMHYRNAAVSSTYFKEDHPENYPLMGWIRQYKKIKKLESDVDVWLSCLEYYLDTPHYAIVAMGEGIRKRYGDAKYLNMFLSKIDPNCDYWHSVDYEVIANHYFLCIWEAADDEEFILSNNAFGIWEGRFNGLPDLHRLYVVSPRVVLVLKNVLTDALASSLQNVHIDSSLADIKTFRAHPTIAHMEVFAGILESDQRAQAAALQQYRTTEAAQDDTFKFQTTKLTASQTLAVNEVLALNTRIEGSITFASSDAMLRSMDSFISSQDRFIKENLHFFHPLVRQLRPPDGETGDDRKFNLVFQAIVSGTREFKSDYDRAYFVFLMTSTSYHPIACEVQRSSALAISVLKKRMNYKPPNFLGRTLCQTLPKQESELFFAIVGFLVTELGFSRREGDGLDGIIQEAVVVGVAKWMAKSHDDVLKDILTPWMDIFWKL